MLEIHNGLLLIRKEKDGHRESILFESSKDATFIKVFTEFRSESGSLNLTTIRFVPIDEDGVTQSGGFELVTSDVSPIRSEVYINRPDGPINEACEKRGDIKWLSLEHGSEFNVYDGMNEYSFSLVKGGFSPITVVDCDMLQLDAIKLDFIIPKIKTQ